MAKDKVIIFGKDTCPYTTAAREEYAARGFDVEYIDVKASAENMAMMLKFSNGSRQVPVIVENGMVVCGFGGT